jgi:tetratricopeptide (TPR) repeat protein
MSLLLDALNRAGKLKSASDASENAKSETDWPAISLLPQEVAPAAPVQPAAVAADSTPTAAPKNRENVTQADAGLSLTPVVDVPEKITVPPGPAEPVQASSLPPEPKAVKAAAIPQTDKLAQTMVRAKTPSVSPSSRRPRLLALGGLAGFLAVGLISVVMGWIDPLAMLSPPSGIGSGNQIAAIAVPPTETPASSATTAPSTESGASAAPPSPASLTVPDKNAVISRNAPAPMPSNKSGSASQAPASMNAAASGGNVAPPRAAGQFSDCGAGSVAGDCRPSSRPAAKARPKAAMPKPPEPPPTMISKVVGPSQLEVAYLALTQGRMTEAAAAYNTALVENPEERDALLGLAYIAHQAAREEEARDLYKRVLRQEPNNPSARAGLLIQSLGNDAEDVSGSSREVAEQHPGSAAAQSVLGHSLVRQGRLADAQQAFQRAHVLEPGVALHAFNLAVAFDRLRSYGPARTYYERALALSRQSGGEASSGISHAVVSNRLQELLSAKATEAPASR